MDGEKSAFYADLASLRFTQSYVKKPTVEAKKWAEHLKTKWGEQWRAHITEVTGLTSKVLRELRLIDIHLPIRVQRAGEIYIVRNGTHTCYHYWNENRNAIMAQEIPRTIIDTPRLYTFNEMRLEED